MVTGRPKRVDNNARRRQVSSAGRSLDHAVNAAACGMISWALAAGAVIILEDLNGMSRGWVRFSKQTRTRLNAAAMMKFQRLICGKARWNGVEVLWIHPRNTSALCSVCRNALSGNYHYRTCVHCHICVDRDVNAVRNMRRTTAAARYGQVVRPSPKEARAKPDVILDPGRLVREGGSLRVDGETGGFG